MRLVPATAAWASCSEWMESEEGAGAFQDAVAEALAAALGDGVLLQGLPRGAGGGIGLAFEALMDAVLEMAGDLAHGGGEVAGGAEKAVERVADPLVVDLDVDLDHGVYTLYVGRASGGVEKRRATGVGGRAHTACSVNVRAPGPMQALGQYRRCTPLPIPACDRAGSQPGAR